MSSIRWPLVLLILAACGGNRSTSSANGPAPREAQCVLDLPSPRRTGSPSYDAPCSKEQLAQAHRKAKAMLASGNASGALTYLSNVEAELKCAVSTGREATNVAAYELALLQLRAQLATKRCAECSSLFAFLDRPYPGGLQQQDDDDDDDDDGGGDGEDGEEAAMPTPLSKIEARLRVVANTCSRRYRRSVSDFKALPCKLGGDKGIAVPRASLPKGVTAACLELAEAPARDTKTLEEGLPCMRLSLHLDGPKGRRTIRLRTVAGRARTADQDDDRSFFALEDPSSCCNEFSLSTARRGGKNVLRVSGPEADCYGGTGRSEIDDYYYWTADGLTEWVRKGVGIH